MVHLTALPTGLVLLCLTAARLTWAAPSTSQQSDEINTSTLSTAADGAVASGAVGDGVAGNGLAIDGVALDDAAFSPLSNTKSSAPSTASESASSTAEATHNPASTSENIVALFESPSAPAKKPMKLHGKFLHITDFHLDPYYSEGSDSRWACHHGSGNAGHYGTPSSDCDSPLSLMDATFDWIKDNIADEIDFIIWTGDSARHDNDESYPRNPSQVLVQNRLILEKFHSIFGAEDHSARFRIPIIPNIGNNDFLPHNIFEAGPNLWTKEYGVMWSHLIPATQKHTFQRIGSFYVEVIPGKLAVISVNSMYLYDSNGAIDDCRRHGQPGNDLFDWLRVQMQFMRERNIKVILIGHVPPARIRRGKRSWDETCWQKYAFWLRNYRDILVGEMWGHMNTDHFILQDFKKIKSHHKRDLDLDLSFPVHEGTHYDNFATTERVYSERQDYRSKAKHGYLTDLRDLWKKLPAAPASVDSKKGRRKQEKYFKKVGGEWHERYGVSLVGPSVVPNYFPGMRVFEYNITGVELPFETDTPPGAPHNFPDPNHESGFWRNFGESIFRHQPYKHPSPPKKHAPPGPAYSPQPFTLKSYTQYYSNLTRINAEHAAEKPIKNFFEKHYSTADKDDIFGLEDLTVRSYVQLAERIGNFDNRVEPYNISGLHTKHQTDEYGNKGKHRKGKKGKKHPSDKEQREINKSWYAFVSRAFVGTLNDTEVREEFSHVSHEGPNWKARGFNDRRVWV